MRTAHSELANSLLAQQCHRINRPRLNLAHDVQTIPVRDLIDPPTKVWHKPEYRKPARR